MGGPNPPKPLRPPAPPDTEKAQINALAYAELERRIRASQGRTGQFLTRNSVPGPQPQKPLLGQ